MAFGAASITVLGKTQYGEGKVKIRGVATLDNAYPVAGYNFNTAAILAALGLKAWLVNAAGNGFQDPVVTGVNQQGLLAEFQALKLLFSYPSGGNQAAPTTVAQPAYIGVDGAVAVKSSAEACAINSTPGTGIALAANTDLSGANVKVYFDAFGYPA